jgi:hypothetical protein
MALASKEETMSMKKLGMGIVLVGFMGSAPMASAAYWTNYVSDEGSPQAFCGFWNESAIGFSCTGGFCDNVRLRCETLPFGSTLNSADDYWSGWFSEESDGVEGITSFGWYARFDENYHVCHYAHANPGFVSGIQCSGSNCDNVKIECTKAVKWNGSSNVYMNVNSCSWSGTYSEENTGNSGNIDFGANRLITGVKCEGSKCDNMRFYVCSMTDPGF